MGSFWIRSITVETGKLNSRRVNCWQVLEIAYSKTLEVFLLFNQVLEFPEIVVCLEFGMHDFIFIILDLAHLFKFSTKFLTSFGVTSE